MRTTIVSAAMIVSLISPQVVSAGTYLVTGGTVTAVTSVSNNAPSFAIKVINGTGNICSSQYIQFNQADAPDVETFKRAYAAALTALTTGTLVTIYNYIDSTCNRAMYIQLGQ